MKYIDDCKTLVSQIKQQDKELRLKRRWLMDLDFTRTEAKQLKKLIPPKDKFLPESLIREDDVYYEDIRASIERGFLPGYQKERYDNKNEEEDENYVQLFNSRRGLKDIFSMLDEMTNKGLCCFAEILTSGLIKFVKTNRQMKKLIKERLLALLKNQGYSSHWQPKLLQLSELLRDPKHFRGNYLAHSTPFKYYRAAGLRVLNELQDLPFQTLSSMHRKIRGVVGYVPQMQPPKIGWGRRVLMKHVRKRCRDLLAELGEADEPPEPLAKALAVAGLTLKLKAKPPEIEFRKFSPETEALQNEIVKAIQLLDDNTKVSFTELKDLLLLLDPNAKSSKRIRMNLRNLLIEYLLECADMGTIPECLREALTIINRRCKMLSSRSLDKEELEKEVECVLTLSAQMKQIIWDSCNDRGNAFDLEFENAYMDDMLESDDGGFNSDDDHPRNSTDPIEGVGEHNPFPPESPKTTPRSPHRRSGIKIEDIPMTEIDSMGSLSFTESKTFDSTMHTTRSQDQYVVGSMGKLESSVFDENQQTRSNGEASYGSTKRNLLHGETELTDDKQNVKRNEYLAIQEACDRTSMVAYNFIGRTLNELAKVQGLKLHQNDVSYLRGDDSGASRTRQTSPEDDVHGGSIFLRVLDELSEEEIMRPFSDSRRAKLKELMGIK